MFVCNNNNLNGRKYARHAKCCWSVVLCKNKHWRTRHWSNCRVTHLISSLFVCFFHFSSSLFQFSAAIVEQHLTRTKRKKLARLFFLLFSHRRSHSYICNFRLVPHWPLGFALFVQAMLWHSKTHTEKSIIGQFMAASETEKSVHGWCAVVSQSTLCLRTMQIKKSYLKSFHRRYIFGI